MKKVILTVSFFLIITSLFVLGQLPACDYSLGADTNIGCVDSDGDGNWDAVCDKSSGTTTFSATLTGTICETTGTGTGTILTVMVVIILLIIGFWYLKLRKAGKQIGKQVIKITKR